LNNRKNLNNYLTFKRVSLCVLLMAFLAGALAVPLRAAAGETEAAAAAQTQVPAKEKAQDETEELNAFRHSPTVTWVSKLIHVDVETTAKGLEYINFGIILLAVGIPLVKFLPKVLRKRSETLSTELETARAATADANSRLSAVEARLAGLDEEISKIKHQVEDEIREDEARIKASIGEESARIVAAAEQEIVVAAALAQRELKRYAADLAIDRALAQLSFSPATDSALIAEFAAEFGQGGQENGSKGGRN